MINTKYFCDYNYCGDGEVQENGNGKGYHASSPSKEFVTLTVPLIM